MLEEINNYINQVATDRTEDLHNLYSLHNIVRLVTWRWICCAGRKQMHIGVIFWLVD